MYTELLKTCENEIHMSLNNFSSGLSFVREAVKNYRKIGSVWPSSKYLARKMVASITPRERMLVVELGSGTGSFTQEILRRLPKDARVYALESNEALANTLVSAITDPRLTVSNEPASSLSESLHTLDNRRADYIISGLPLSLFSEDDRQKTLDAITHSLSPDGVYVQFQYFRANLSEIQGRFNDVRVSFELRNIPPAFVYVCREPRK